MIQKVLENLEHKHRMMVVEVIGDGFWLIQDKVYLLFEADRTNS